MEIQCENTLCPFESNDSSAVFGLGALYPDNTGVSEKADDGVAPGKSYTYIWTLDSSHAPAKDDDNCLTRVYHSHTSAPKDIASGLLGPIIICKKGIRKF